MDRQHCVQDVLRCHLCDTPHPSLHCDICAEYLCEACKGEHLSDLSKEHEVLPFRGRELLNAPNIPQKYVNGTAYNVLSMSVWNVPLQKNTEGTNF